MTNPHKTAREEVEGHLDERPPPRLLVAHPPRALRHALLARQAPPRAPLSAALRDAPRQRRLLPPQRVLIRQWHQLRIEHYSKCGTKAGWRSAIRHASIGWQQRVLSTQGTDMVVYLSAAPQASQPRQIHKTICT